MRMPIIGDKMIRFRLKELIAEYQYREGRVLTLAEISAATGINRNTLSKIANDRGATVVSSNIDLLCKFFDCQVSDVMVYVPD